MAPRLCANGHDLQEGFAFCPQCGAAAAEIERTDSALAPTPGTVGSDVSSGGSRPPLPPPAATPISNASAAMGMTSSSRVAALMKDPAKRPALIGAGAVVAITILALVFAFGGERHTVEGEFTLMDPEGYSETFEGGGCSGDGGYDDISAGTQVNIRDGSGELLASSSLDVGEDMTIACTFPFTVEDVPKADFYSVEVGDRGDLSFSYDEMVESDWYVSLSLG
jgi:hypothetical protein